MKLWHYKEYVCIKAIMHVKFEISLVVDVEM